MPRKTFCVLAAALLAVGTAAHAGVYSDDFSKCLVRSTTPKDKTDLVRWVFANAALHPDVSSIAAVSESQRTAINRATGAIVERLFTESCRAQFRDALKYEGSHAVEQSFEVLGGVAMRELLTDPAVAKAFSGLDAYVDQDKVKAVVQESQGKDKEKDQEKDQE